MFGGVTYLKMFHVFDLIRPRQRIWHGVIRPAYPGSGLTASHAAPGAHAGQDGACGASCLHIAAVGARTGHAASHVVFGAVAWPVIIQAICPGSGRAASHPVSVAHTWLGRLAKEQTDTTGFISASSPVFNTFTVSMARYIPGGVPGVRLCRRPHGVWGARWARPSRR